MSHRILYVDEEPSAAAEVRYDLRHEDLDVLTATSAEEALRLLEAHEVEVVVSGEEMAELRGAEFLALVKRAHPEVVRLILTRDATLDDAYKALHDADVYRFLKRPFKPEDLVHCIEQAIDAREDILSQEQRSQRAPSPSRAKRELLTAAFDRALESLWIAFQPIVSTARNAPYAYEALVRSDDGEIGNPAALFSVAEELGRISELDARIRAQVALEIPQAPGDAVFMVNVHPRSLLDPRLFERNDPLRAHAERVVLEITERSSLAETPDLQQVVARLRTMGYRLAVDDLGAGYASLTSIALLVPDFVKFDMDLVRDVHTSPTKAKLIRGMAALCEELEVRTVAEGIESPEERDCLIGLGCDLLQGYLFARPAKGFAMPTVA